MSTVKTYPKYSEFVPLNRETALKIQSKMLEQIIPFLWEGVPISLFAVGTSDGGSMLLLSDALKVKIAHLVNGRFHEVFPIVYENFTTTTEKRLVEGIQEYGESLDGGSKIVAFQVNSVARSALQTFSQSLYAKTHAINQLMQLISRQSTEVDIGDFRIRRIPNNWKYIHPTQELKGLAYEQDDHLISLWIHEPNTLAHQTAQNQEQRLVSRYQKKQTNTYQTQDIIPRLISPESVHSAIKPTLQCVLNIQIDDPHRIYQLDLSLCNSIVMLIQDALERFSWNDLKIQENDIVLFLMEIFNSLEADIVRLSEIVKPFENKKNNHPSAEYIFNTILSEWGLSFLPEKKKWVSQTFSDYCASQVGDVKLTKQEINRLSKSWSVLLNNKLKELLNCHSLTERHLIGFGLTSQSLLKIPALEILKGPLLTSLPNLGIEGCDAHRKLDQYYKQRDLIQESLRMRKTIHLVARLGVNGIVYALMPLPQPNLQQLDPLKTLNEVHIPVTWTYTPPMRDDLYRHLIDPQPLVEKRIAFLALGIIAMGYYCLNY